jgi:hypothetical protein
MMKVLFHRVIVAFGEKVGDLPVLFVGTVDSESREGYHRRRQIHKWAMERWVLEILELGESRRNPSDSRHHRR